MNINPHSRMLFIFLLIYSCSTNSAKQASRNVAQENLEFLSEVDPSIQEKTSETTLNLVRIVNERAVSDPEHAARRDTHSKHHGCVKAVLKVNSEMPAKYRAGIFKKPGASYNTWLRFSNGRIGVHNDLLPDDRSISVKVMGVEGDKLLKNSVDEELYTQDFVTNGYPAFPLETPEDAKTFFKDWQTGRPSEEFSGLRVLAKNSRRRALVKVLLAAATTYVSNPLNTTYWSCTPFKLGSTITKFAIRPCGGEKPQEPLPFAPNIKERLLIERMKTLHQRYATAGDSESAVGLALAYSDSQFVNQSAEGLSLESENYLSESMRKSLSSDSGACFEFGVQSYVNDTITPTAVRFGA